MMVELDNKLIKRLRQSANKHGLEDVLSGCGMSKSAFYKYINKTQKTIFQNKYNRIIKYLDTVNSYEAIQKHKTKFRLKAINSNLKKLSRSIESILKEL